MADENLVFIVSTPRAGSTLLGAMLASHSAMTCPPEPWLLLPLATLRSDRVRAHAAYGYEMARDAVRQLADENLLDAGCAAMVRRIYGELAGRAGKRIFVDKTPRYFHILPRLDAMFPGAKQIWINRNPLDVMASLKETWSFPIGELVGDVVSPYTFDATIALRRLADHFDHRTPNQFIVRYEDLAADPEAEARKLCAFLGVDFEAGMLEYGRNTALVGTYRAGSMGDKKVLEHGRAHTKSLGAWKRKLSPEEVGRIVRTLGPAIFARLGYGAAWAEACEFADVEVGSIPADGELDRIERQYESYEGTEKLALQLAQSESDRAKRLELIESMGKRIEEIEADRAKRLEVIETSAARIEKLAAENRNLAGRWERAGAELAERDAAIANQAVRINMIEADRANRLKALEAAAGRLELCEADRARRLEALEATAERLREVEADRARRLEVIEKSAAEIKVLRTERDAARAALESPAGKVLRRIGLLGDGAAGDRP